MLIWMLLSLFSWLVNGINRTREASQKKYTSTLNLTASVDVTVNCTCSNHYGEDWKAEIVILGEKITTFFISGGYL